MAMKQHRRPWSGWDSSWIEFFMIRVTVTCSPTPFTVTVALSSANALKISMIAHRIAKLFISWISTIPSIQES